MKTIVGRVVYRDMRGGIHRVNHTVRCESIVLALDLLEKIIEANEGKHSWNAISVHIKIERCK